ncbi:MAG TPA: FABP family protein [Aeromicrobium sp.]|nr:FABP family protein [Aeromicrobium sp.]
MAFEIPSDLHPDLMPVAWLLGAWHGNGHGDYPTIDPFAFEQDVVFAHDGRPFLHYFSRSWVTEENGERIRPGAMETGFLRPAGEGKLELVMAHPTGYAEIWHGEIEGAKMTLSTDVVARTVTSKEYTAGQRMYGLVEGSLMYAFDMAAVGQPLQSHLWGKLDRV